MNPVVRQPTRLLPCEHCGTWTKHTLSKDGKLYVCACGETTDYLIVKSRLDWEPVRKAEK